MSCLLRTVSRCRTDRRCCTLRGSWQCISGRCARMSSRYIWVRIIRRVVLGRLMSILAGRIALITGASQGIGRACALELARAGASVALAARNLDKLAEVAAEIAAAGGTAHAFALDVASEESIKDCAKAVIAHFGGVNILVNNAGITRDILALRMKRKDWDDVLTTNLTGAFLMTQAVMSQMVKSRWGRIINVTSVVGETGQAGQAKYAPSKTPPFRLPKSPAPDLSSRHPTAT